MHILNISTEKLLMACVCLSSSLKAAELVDLQESLIVCQVQGQENKMLLDVTSIILV